MITILTIQDNKVVGDISGFDTITEAVEYVKTLPTLPNTRYAVTI